MAHPFSAGRVLGRSFPIWTRNIVKFTILYAIVYLPLVAYGILAFPRLPEQSVGEFMTFTTILGFGWILFWFIAPLGVIQGVLQELRGERATFSGCVRVYLTRIFPALGVGLFVGFLAFLSTIPVHIIAWSVDDGLRMILALLPATLVACVYWVAVPVAASERPGVAAAMQRSARLTRGSRASVFALVLVVIALQVAPVFLARVSQLPGNLAWIFLLLLMVFGSYGAVATSVAYHDLRIAKDGVGAEEIARVFA